MNNGSRPLSEAINNVEQGPPPGRVAVLLTALSIGILLMGLQLWLLTIALDLYLAGGSVGIWILAAISGVVFLGGVLIWRVLRRNPRSIRQLS